MRTTIVCDQVISGLDVAVEECAAILFGRTQLLVLDGGVRRTVQSAIETGECSCLWVDVPDGVGLSLLGG